jgi:transposase
MEQSKPTTKIAGIDVGKHRLDVAVHGLEDMAQVDNTAEGIAELIGWLAARGVGRVGMEASGGYERAVRQALEAEGLEVVVHQPLEVRLFARLKRRRAKNDRLDARLIAAATVQVGALRAARDPQLADLAERLTAYELITDKAADLKTQLESITQKDIAATVRTALRSLLRAKARLLAQAIAAIKARTDLRRRFSLLLSLPGIGPVVAATLVVRMPELGSMDHGQAAALAGVAPFDRDSGQWKGQRFIGGGRARPRRMLYLAALAAKRSSPTFKAFAERLQDNGKAPKVILVALMRKLIEAANLVLARGHPWTPYISQPT